MAEVMNGLVDSDAVQALAAIRRCVQSVEAERRVAFARAVVSEVICNYWSSLRAVFHGLDELRETPPNLDVSPTHMDRWSMALPVPSGSQPPGWMRRKLAMRSGEFTQGCCRDGFERLTARTTPLRHCVNGCWIWPRRPESTGVRRGCSIRRAGEARSLRRWPDAWSSP